ncbi:TIGR04222 domain-containing membrane protein [Streptomyces sp. NPDC048639]|uniref:TIGR04222 domain-containing membrane protein n=1 Tax=Streptomyces sp. NPDC048639 TaxID=3365581 RepID=UPI00372325AF
MWVLFLLVACAAAVASAVRLVGAAATASRRPGRAAGAVFTAADHDTELPTPAAVSVYEAAFLAGGPRRVADLTLLSLARQRRLLLAHTGWATVVDPDGGDELERSVITAIGPDGQSRVSAIRTAVGAAEAVRSLADRLVAAGLAVPSTAVTNIATAVRQGQFAALLVVLTGTVSLFMLPPEAGAAPVVAWFALPLALISGALAIAHLEMRTSSLWASPAGMRLLGRIAADSVGRSGDGASGLTAFAVRGPAALKDPELRAALQGGGDVRPRPEN